MIRMKIKPLSVNKCWRGGRRFRTNEYEDYESEMLMLLPKLKIPTGKLKLKFVLGFSNKGSDIDNAMKPTIDILQKAYDFNDKMIYQLEAVKVDVPKGEEFLEFELSTYR